MSTSSPFSNFSPVGGGNFKYFLPHFLFLRKGLLLWNLTLILVCFVPDLLRPQTIIPSNPNFKSYWLKVDSIRLQLPDKMIRNETEKIVLHSFLLQKGIDYQIDYMKGLIRFQIQIPDTSYITISYEILPIQLKDIFYKRKYTPGGGRSTDSTGIRVEKSAEPSLPQKDFGNQLRWSGSLVRGVQIGNEQNLNLNSGLRMQIEGKASENVEVNATLTDENTPIQPEGNTQTLNEVDKVFIQVKSTHLKATLGDYYLNYQETQFGRYSRKLQGAMGEAHYPNYDLMASGAVSRGQFHTLLIQGQEGNQGPYQLRGKNGELDIIVLAGTERVWVDGQLMTRGEDNDYIIEYGNGTITFTRKKLITSDSRIEIDYQYSTEQYRRNMYNVRAKANWFDNRFQIGGTFISEEDNRQNPIGLTLSQPEIDTLQRAGDNPSAATINGAIFVGTNSGTYVRIDTTLNSRSYTIYRYVGVQKGDYHVRFAAAPPGQPGDYQRNGLGHYEFKGIGQGDYLPIVPLPMPQKQNLANFDFSFIPVETMKISGEYAVSQFDRNTYSAKDDGNNTGLANRLGFSYQPRKIQAAGVKMGDFDLTGNYRFIGSRFFEIDRTTAPEYSRKWNLGGTSQNGEQTYEIVSKYKPKDFFEIRGGGGKLLKGNFFSSARNEFGSTVGGNRYPLINYFVEWIDAKDNEKQLTSSWKRQNASTAYSKGKWNPSILYNHELKEDMTNHFLKNTSFSYQEYGAKLALNDWNRQNASIEYTVRKDEGVPNDSLNKLEGKSAAVTQKYSWSLSEWKALSMNLEYTHRTKDFTRAFELINQKDVKTDLADFRFLYSPFERAVSSEFRYQISNERSPRLERTYLPTEVGRGTFRKDSSEYIPDPIAGNYILVVTPTGIYEPVVDLKTSLRLNVRWGKFFPQSNAHSSLMESISRFFGVLSTQTFIRVEERSKTKNPSEIYGLHFSKFQNDSTTIFGNYDILHDFNWWEGRREFSIRLRIHYIQEKNNLYVGGEENHFQREQSFRLFLQLAQTVFSMWELEHRNEFRQFSAPGRIGADVQSYRLVSDISWRPRQTWELGAKVSYADANDQAPFPATNARIASFNPRAGYYFSGKGRLRAEFEWTNVTLTPQKQFIPFDLSQGHQAGDSFRWSLILDYRINNYLTASGNYNATREAGQDKTIQVGRAEIRAYF